MAFIILGLGMMMRSDANFADEYVARQLSEQRITFKSADGLTPEERQTPCLAENAGKPLTTGEQAECYANSFIARHLKAVAGGQTYSQMREVQTSLRAQLATAQANNDPAAAELQRQLNEVTAKRLTLFEGETVRGLLLTSYGFSTLGDKAAQGAAIAFATGGTILLPSLVLLARGVARLRPAPSERPAGPAASEPHLNREMASAGRGSAYQR